MKIGRNDQCPCNSGLKYKQCCLGKSIPNREATELADIDAEIWEASALAIEHDREKVEKAVTILTTILQNPKLSENQLVNARMGLAIALQHLGEHKKALEVIDQLKDKFDGQSDLSIGMLIRTAISYNALGYTKEASGICDDIIEHWKNTPLKNKEDKRIRGVHLIEFGKTYSFDDQKDKAIKCWETAVKYLKGIKAEAEHYVRAKANIAFMLLHDEELEQQQKGVEQLEELTKHKLLIGDLRGVANNYCNLGTYFRKVGKYERAIAYYRKDLYLSRIVGDKRDIASTLGNIATLYAELKQFSDGRQLLREAKKIGEELKDEYLIAITEHQLAHLNKLAKDAGINKIPVGEKALCLCGSGNQYKQCCGRADFEPVDIPRLYGGISEDIQPIVKEITETGKQPSPLDFILRCTSESKRRHSWCKIEGHDGWISVHELPDMANIHLISAKEMASAAKDDPEGISKPLSAVILSVCHLEAFANQLSFFIHDNHSHPEVNKLILPEELVDKGVLQFQRTTQLEAKWFMLSECLLGKGWLESHQPIWNEVKDLIYIRNELVHFKTSGYEKVVPLSSEQDSIYKKIPKKISNRTVPHSWPMKVLTPALANWAVEISELITDTLRQAYSSNRRNQSA